ncbi:glycoside hydrolase family 44-domain-containing protein [Gloeopeniophorella convolvens]|nr:glycoside hydrolase family 44-domain-containing protein [Gloeopeniophorella convolvens]
MLVSLALLLAVPLVARADQWIYTDTALASPWQDWSWATINWDATNVFEGASSVEVTAGAYAALSVYTPSPFASSYAGLQFDVSGADIPANVQFYIQSTASNNQSLTIPLSAFDNADSINAANFTTLILDFSNLPGNSGPLGNDSWDRINWQAEGNGATFNIDNLVLLDEIIVTPQFLSAEPLGTNLIAVTSKGAVNYTSLSIELNNKPLKVTSIKTVPTVDIAALSITYLTLAAAFSAGTLTISATDSTAPAAFNFTLPSPLSGAINNAVTHPISPRVYGVNFPTDADYIQHLGVTIARRGGNAETAYNPFGGFTNAGNDWYFENRADDSADDWVGWVNDAGADAIMLIPALDWVSKDATSYSYSRTVFPDQEAYDPYNADAGDGTFPNGSWVPTPPQTTAYTPWNTSLAKTWLTGLANRPQVVTIDNEIEIASNTHQDMHPVPLDYDEELARVLNFSAVAKAALPGVEVAAPSTCAWWFYWTSEVGDPDKAAHNGSDFLPWFLSQVRAHDLAKHTKSIDYLDLHYYFAPDTSANDDAAKALRLRMTRSFWDPTYVDESWIGTDTPSNSQPNANAVMLIPRMQTLIKEHYPGLKLSVSEWSSTADDDLTGGLLTVDALGIFGRHQLDQATYWSDPSETGPIGLAYWLFRGYGTHFGDLSAQVNIPSLNPDTLGVYASTSAVHNNASLVVVNKDPAQPVALHLSGVPAGTYFVRHFGGLAGVAKYQTTTTISSFSYLVVPAYTAVFLQQQTPTHPRREAEASVEEREVLERTFGQKHGVEWVEPKVEPVHGIKW